MSGIDFNGSKRIETVRGTRLATRGIYALTLKNATGEVLFDGRVAQASGIQIMRRKDQQAKFPRWYWRIQHKIAKTVGRWKFGVYPQSGIKHYDLMSVEFIPGRPHTLLVEDSEGNSEVFGLQIATPFKVISISVIVEFSGTRVQVETDRN